LWWAALVSFCVLTSLELYARAQHGQPASLTAWGAFAVTAETVVGLLFWMWRPGNIVGPLLVFYVQFSYLTFVALDAPHSRLALTVGVLFAYAYTVPLWVMLWSFPNGRMWKRWLWWLIAWLVVGHLAQNLPPLLVGYPRSYFYLGHGWGGLDAWNKAWWVVGAVTALVLSAILIARLVAASPGARRRIAPLYLPSVLIVIPTFYYWSYLQFTNQAWPAPQWISYELGYGQYLYSAIGAAIGLALVQRARGSVGDLVVDLGRVEPGQVRPALARTLGDPTLELGLWLPERGVWVDEQGRELVLPEDGSRGVTFLGDRLAVLVHDHDLLDQRKLLEPVGSAARLALEHGRLQAELRIQLAEVRASRARIVRAGDEERRRLERGLRAGAERRLLAFGAGLGPLGSHLDAGGQALLGELRGELQAALAELRELARGIHPALLSQRGLAAAVRALGARAPVPVTVEASGERLPESVETACYFVVAEALANVAKYAHASEAWVTVARENGTAVVEVGDDGVGGADAANGGSGLRGLADRVGALDGRLSVESPPGGGTRVRALIPCPPDESAAGSGKSRAAALATARTIAR
jgi:signal transduction histidine kinase